MRSNIASMRNCSGSMPPSSLSIEFRRKPVATPLILRRIGQQIAGDLFDEKLIVRHVRVESVHDPVAIHPHEARLVLLETVGVGVTCGVEPNAAPTFAEVGRGQEPLDFLFIRAFARGAVEGIQFLKRWRQADEVERKPAQQRGRRRWRRRRSSSFSSRARTNASIGLRTQPSLFTAGTSGRRARQRPSAACTRHPGRPTCATFRSARESVSYQNRPAACARRDHRS